MDNSSIIMRIEIRLKELGKTKSEFYKGAGITSATYSQWNTNMFEPSNRKLESVARYLGVTVDYLRHGTETEKAPTTPSERTVSDDDIKFALFGGDGEITDAMYERVKQFAAFIKQEEAEKKKE